jgi:CRISPR-associated protein Cas2
VTIHFSAHSGHHDYMQERPLYVGAYDIGDPRRQAKARELLKAYSVGGQKSVYECFLSQTEKRAVISGMAGLIKPWDRFFLVRLDPRSRILTLGRAIAPQDPPFFYVG